MIQWVLLSLLHGIFILSLGWITTPRKLKSSFGSLVKLPSILLIVFNVVHLTCLSPSWCVMCKAHVKSPAHLFMHCPFASRFWHNILDAFGWSIPCSNNIFDISLLVGHPLLVLRKRLGWLFFALSFGLCGASVISVSLKIQFPLLTHFLILCCLLLFIGAKLGTV